MARLPDVFSYGARPSVRSNRFDEPDKSGLMLAEALENAANTFTQMAGEKKAKDDRMNYALAKNEILQADIASREELRDDEDWATYDERYTTGFNTRRDDILGKYNLSPSDSALLAAESDLLRERGRINVADASRLVEVDEKASTLDAQLLEGRELVLSADNATANEIMLSLLDSIGAARDEFLDDEQALAKSQAFVKDVASARLIGMDPKLREVELERSLAARTANGPITVEEISEGKGTGSIADFLPADVVTRMLKQVKDENKLDLEYENAIALRDQAMALFPEDSQAMIKWVRENSKGLDGKTRARAEQMARQIAEERRVADTEERSDIMIAAGELLTQTDDQGRFTHGIEDLPRDQLAKLSPAQRAQLEAYHSQLRNNKQFADFTNWRNEERDENGDLVNPSYATWSGMSYEEKAAADLTHPMWHTNFEREVWRQMVNEQEDIKKQGLDKEKSIQTIDQIMTDVWAGELGLPRTGRDQDEDEMYHRMRSMAATQIDQLSDSKYNGQSVPDSERKDIIRRVMSAELFKRDSWWGPVGFVFHIDGNTAIPVAEADPDDHEDYFVPLQRWANLETTIEIGSPPEPVKITWEDKLKRMATLELDGRVPEQKDLENAYAQIVMGGDPAEVRARVLEALAGKYEH